MHISDPQKYFLNKLNLSANNLTDILSESLKGADDGDLFLEDSQQQTLLLENGKVKTTAFSENYGMGLRRVDGEMSALIHSNDINSSQLENFLQQLHHMRSEGSHSHLKIPATHKTPLYEAINPISGHSIKERIKLLNEINSYLRAKDSRVQNVTASIGTNLQQVMIARQDGNITTDVRPMVLLRIGVVMSDGKNTESSFAGFGGRFSDDILFSDWKSYADKAFHQAEILLKAVHAPAGAMPLVLAAGWSGILFHEAVGHGLEGDFNRKGTSAFTGLLGQKVASEKVTIIDDGTIPNRRGSLNVDDEGTPTQRTTLIENGILKGYMLDRTNARLLGMPLTGNGRRESYSSPVIPRMTNTFLQAGDDKKETPEAIISDTENGLFAKSFGGGQVDITSGNFTFEVTEAYIIKNGKLGKAVKGATLSGNGPNIIKYIDRVANDLELDAGVGSCGKAGQTVPVGVGQPTIRLTDGITVGGK